MSKLTLQGTVSAGFQALAAAFERNFAEGQELGAALCVYLKGEKVVDLWAGWRDADRQQPWQENTLAPLFHAAQGMLAASLAVAHARGWLDYDQPVARYWPEFAQQGKEAIRVRQLLSCQAGLCAVDEPLQNPLVTQPGALADLLARQSPAWEPGAQHGYAFASLGYFEAELLRRVDPNGRDLESFFAEEIAGPLGVELLFAAPPAERLADARPWSTIDLVGQVHAFPWRFLNEMLNTASLTYQALNNPPPAALKPGFFAPSANGYGSARDLARLYAALAAGELPGSSAATLEALSAPPAPPRHGAYDQVLHTNTCYSLGFMKPFPAFEFGQAASAFGIPGAGGAFAYADPQLQLGYAYLPNRMGFNYFRDPRDVSLRRALKACLEGA